MVRNCEVRFAEIDNNIEVRGTFCGASIPGLAPNPTTIAVGLVMCDGRELFRACRTHNMLISCRRRQRSAHAYRFRGNDRSQPDGI